MTDQMKQFDALAMRLPGVHSIAASAGTGKTYTIATLYLRYLLETDCAVGEILVTTYTESATAELKDRLRARLQEAAQVLRSCGDLAAARQLIDDDLADRTVVGVLEQAGAWDAAREHQVADRLATAILDFDHAPISTIHGFCSRVLQELVFETGSRFDVELVASQQPLIDEAVADFVSRWWTGPDPAMSQWLPIEDKTWKLMSRIASLAVDNPSSPMAPASAGLEVLLDSPLMSEFDAAIRTLTKLWNADGKEACDLVVAARDSGWLNGNKYGRANQIPDAIGFIDGLIQLPTPDQFKLDNKSGRAAAEQRRLSQVDLIAGTKKDHQDKTPRHKVFEQIDVVIEAVSRIHAHRDLVRVQMLARMARDVRSAVQQQKDEQGVLGFSDLLHGVDTALAGPQRASLLQGLRSKFRVAMVDEFQDTDPVQYRIFRRAFQEDVLADDETSGRAFVMIGDPKQSIYRFRGADIHSYLRATHRTPEANRHSMHTNWRSDRSLVSAVQAVFDSTSSPFLSDDIPLPPIQAHHDDRMADGPAFEVTFVERDPRLASDKAPSQADALNRVAHQIGADIVTQLSDPPMLRSGDGVDRPVTPGDLAVLCRTGTQLRAIQSELSKRGVPAVLQTDESIFDTPEAGHMVLVLRALLEPGRRTAMINALLTPILGLDAEKLEVLRQDERELSEWGQRFQEWHDLWQGRSFIVAWRRLLERAQTVPNLSGLIMGERKVTNYLHLGELLHREAVRRHAGPDQMLRWLVQSVADPSRRSDDATQLRLETDAAAVQLCTIHKSKGLEYGIVYCPTLWHVFGGTSDPFVLARLDENGESLEIPEIDVGSNQIDARRTWNSNESLAEDRRLLYVALTRGKHQCRVYWTAVKNAGASALGQIMLGDVDNKETDAGLEAHLRSWHERMNSSGMTSRTGAQVRESIDPGAYQPAIARLPELKARPIRRTSIPRLRQTSFTALAGSVDHNPTAGAADRDETLPTLVPDPSQGAGGEAVPLANMPGGRKIGDVVHRVFEDALGDDSIHGEGPEAITERVGELLEPHMPRVQLGTQWRDPLSAAVAGCLTHALPLESDSCRLADISPDQLARELHFMLRAGAGDSYMDPRGLSEALAKSPRTFVQTYATRIKNMDVQRIRGFLEGYIDLVFQHNDKWYLLDYKTNKLGPAWKDYDAPSLENAMAGHDYVLQYHLYCAALDQFLSQRVPGYSYDQHFGGAAYLFVRGFNPEVHPSSGVYFDRPDPAVIQSIASVLRGERLV